jgi:hypothetical protein
MSHTYGGSFVSGVFPVFFDEFSGPFGRHPAAGGHGPDSAPPSTRDIGGVPECGACVVGVMNLTREEPGGLVRDFELGEIVTARPW